MENAKGLDSPTSTVRLVPEGEPLDQKVPYRSAVGCLIWLAINTRPDIISYAVSQVARFSSSPTKDHWKAVKHILRYLRGTSDLGIQVEKTENFVLQVMEASCSNLAATIIQWKSTPLRSVCLSSTESEFVFLSMRSNLSIEDL